MVTGCDIDPEKIKTACLNVKKVKRAQCVESQLEASTSADDEEKEMEVDEGAEKERKVKQLLGQIKNLPKSCQIALSGQLDKQSKTELKYE